MKKWLILGSLVTTHALLTICSVNSLFGMSFKPPEDRPPIRRIVWGGVAMITWQPLLYPVCYNVKISDRRLVDSHPYVCVGVNSVAAVGLGYAIFALLRKGRTKQGSRKT